MYYYSIKAIILSQASSLDHYEYFHILNSNHTNIYHWGRNHTNGFTMIHYTLVTRLI